MKSIVLEDKASVFIKQPLWSVIDNLFMLSFFIN